MSSLVDQLEQLIKKANWPVEHRTTMTSRNLYEKGLDTVNTYRGHPQVFIEALQIFQATRSSPYAYAGIAYTLAMAASNQPVDQKGLEKALQWLEKSQKLESDRVEINFIEAFIYLNQGQLQNSRMVLDYLGQQDVKNYYLCLTEVNYWERQKNDDKYHHWLRQAVTGATTPSRYVFVMNSLANFYLNRKLYEQSIKIFQHVSDIDPQDPWLWHNMSVMYVRMERFREADQCNKRALAIMDFEAAREIEAIIKKKRGGLTRLLGG